MKIANDWKRDWPGWHFLSFKIYLDNIPQYPYGKQCRSKFDQHVLNVALIYKSKVLRCYLKHARKKTATTAYMCKNHRTYLLYILNFFYTNVFCFSVL